MTHLQVPRAGLVSKSEAQDEELDGQLSGI